LPGRLQLERRINHRPRLFRFDVLHQLHRTLISANSAVTVLRSPSGPPEAVCSAEIAVSRVIDDAACESALVVNGHQYCSAILAEAFARRVLRAAFGTRVR
jgi:hypothetical protein